MKRSRVHVAGLVCCTALLVAWPAAHAAGTDLNAGSAQAKQRLWRLHEFTRIEIVPREAGSPENLQPTTVPGEALRQQLALVQHSSPGGKTQPLFGSEELAELAGPLAQALGQAGPGEDIVLLSTARRQGNLLGSPMAITARLFMQPEGLQLIVHDARLDFYDNYRGTQALPRFAFGSRAAPGAATIAGSGLANRRADWVSMPLSGVAAPAPATAPAPSPVVAPKATSTSPAAAGDDIERRLETLKRLRERGLITEDEYQQKRRDILQRL